jgi:outer membrane immunogenic protein
MKILIALLMLGTAAHAADLRLKAPAYVTPICTAGVPMTPTMAAIAPSCSGPYAGFGVEGLGSNLDILGSGINNSVFAGGGIIKATGGYQFWNGQFFLAGEANAGINLANNGLGAQVGVGKNWDASIIAKAGVGLSNVLGIGSQGTVGAGTPSQGINLAVIPGTSLMSPYLAIGESFKQGNQGWTMGAGTEFILAQGWNLDIYYHHINWQNSQMTVLPGALPAAVVSTTPENRVGFAFLKMF